MSAGGNKLDRSTLVHTVLAPVLADHIPFLITPYIGLRARLSQVWINRWTILLVLVLIRTLLAVASMNHDIDSARKEALSACTGVEAAGSAMASMPHYLSQGVNELTAAGVEKAVDGLMSMLTMTVTGVEELIVFVVNMMTSTYLCLITLVVSGSLHAAVALIQDVATFLNKTLGSIGDDIQGAVNTFENGLNDVISGLNDVGSIFGGGHNSIPTLNLDTQINDLQTLKLPSGLTSDLQTLNNSIPTFTQVQTFADNVIRTPFEMIKQLINESTGNYTMNRSLLPVPAKQYLSFCSDDDGINGFFDGIVDLLYKARKIAVAVLLVLAVVVCVPMAYREVLRHHKMQERAALLDAGVHDPMEIVYIASRPTSAGLGLKLASTFKATRRQQLVRWAIAYATTVPALFVLSLGVAGLISCLCRYVILVMVTKEVPSLANEVANFADKVVESLDNASYAWANSTNAVILDLNSRINHDVFGWVNTSTHAVNETLNVFVNDTIHILNQTFGGTILYDPVTEIFNCLIGLKIASVEKGLTWVSDHAHVDFPLLPNNTFSLGAAASITNGSDASSFLASPSSGTKDALSGIVDSLAEHVANSIRTEALISSGVVAVWVIIALIGIIRALWLFCRKGNVVSGDNHYSNKSSPSFISAETFPMPTLPRINDFNEKSANHPTVTSASQSQPWPMAMPIPSVQVQPPSSDSSPSAPSAPSYRIRDQDMKMKSASPTTDSGNTYKGAAYTLEPRPFPRFTNGWLPSNPQSQPRSAPGSGAMRHVGKRQVGESALQQSTQRTSAHADLSEMSGIDRSASDGLRQ